MSRRKNLVGQKFGRLFVLQSADPTPTGQAVWQCVCDCGTIKSIRGYDLAGGKVISCGCKRTESFHSLITKHGRSSSRTYESWQNMHQRCSNPNNPNYPYYGALGVSVCERWSEFQNFLEDMGERPEGLTLDRVDPCGNYEPSNCRWASRLEQSRNQRRHNGKQWTKS